jgi:glycosyltransferase involved in cell wall biosynthesis
MKITDTAVVYLARYSPSYVGINEFLNSYEEFPAGTTHTLYILAKGFPDAGSIQILRNMLSERELNSEIIEIEDSVGYDLQAYMVAAKNIEENEICFINTFSVLKATNWLLKLKGAYEQNNVGMVGGTGSFESIRNSWEAYLKFQIISDRYKFNRKLVRDFYSLSQNLNPNAKKVYDSKILRIKKYLGDIKHKRPNFNLSRDLDSINRELNEIIMNHDGFNFVKDFPFFPNPHLRTNFFMINKNDFMLFEKKLLESPTKMACSIVESGFESLSRHFLKKGKRLLVVNSDGDFFDLERWVESNTFRLGSQAKLLCSDNRTGEFCEMDDYSKLTHQKFTYGSLLDSNSCDILGFSFKFDKNQIPNVLTDTNEQTKISIIIPTRCREYNVLQILKMIKNEEYSNWELIVFRNNASKPFTPFDEFKSDSRIKFFETTQDLAVTESWNTAIKNATGEYLVLLGDDDGILQGSLEFINKLVKKFRKPEAIYSNILQFQHPGSKSIFDPGSVNFIETCDLLMNINEPFLMNELQRKGIGAASLNFDRSFYFATQPLVFRKDFSIRISVKEKPFNSIFPDYYFSNLVFLTSKSLVMNPIPITFQGISIKSFGSKMMQNDIKAGFKDLKVNNYNLHPALVKSLNKIPFDLQDSYQVGVADAIINLAQYLDQTSRFNFNKFLFNYYLELRPALEAKNIFLRIQFNYLLKCLFREFFYFFISYLKQLRSFSLHFSNLPEFKIILKAPKSFTLNRGSFTSGFEVYEKYRLDTNIL